MGNEFIDTLQLISKQQKCWAEEHVIKFDNDGYTLNLSDNLYRPLIPEAEVEFGSGRGDELGNSTKRGKMQALHSSSALVINVFQYWREIDRVDVIAKALDIKKKLTTMKFERTYPTRLRGIPPHLDVELSNGTFRVAIESKFTEIYHRYTKRELKDAYVQTPGLWVGLPKCESLAKLIHSENGRKTSFSYLDAPQLLKHILGLKSQPDAKPFKLIYLWYEYPSKEAEKHRLEIEKFTNWLGDEVSFSDMTYQELFKALSTSQLADKGYLPYLGERYFKFSYILEELRKQLLDASMHLEIWQELWPTTKVVDVINRYKGFFLPTRNAHIDRFYIKVCNVMSSRSSQPSFYRVFSMLNENAALAPGVDVRSLKKRLESHKNTVNAIQDYRNKRGAHWDVGIQAQRKPVILGNCKRMLAELQDIFNEISGAATKNMWSFEYMQHSDTNTLLNHLNELRVIHKKQIDILKKHQSGV